MAFRSLLADLILGGTLTNAYDLTGSITVGQVGGLRIVVDGDHDAILFYDAGNNLVLSLAPAAGSDGAGNTWPLGLKVGKAGSAGAVLGYSGTTGLLYFPGVVANIQGDAALLMNHIGTGNAAQSFLTIGSAQDNAQLDSVAINLFSSSHDGTGLAHVAEDYLDPTGSGHAYRTLDYSGCHLTGVTTGVHPGTGTARTNVAVAETWQTPALNTGWASGPAGGTVQPIQYRMTADGYTLMLGAFHTTSATPNSIAFTLPGGYFNPAQDQRFAVVVDIGGTLSTNAIKIDRLTGNVAMLTALASTNADVYVSALLRPA